jgi:uncharacterized OB-fold protein
MAFCPKCKSEYIDGVTTCEDCGSALVEERPAPEPREAGQFVEIWKTQGEMDAQLIRALLESHGINVLFRGEALRLTHGLTVDGLAEVRILVPADQAKRSREILSMSEGMILCEHCGRLAAEGDKRCPSCGQSLGGHDQKD